MVLAYDLVGRGLNGTLLNGKVLEGHILAAVSLSGVQWNGQLLRDLELEGTTFKGKGIRGGGIHSRTMVGAIFQGTLEDGEPLEVRVDGARLSTDPGMEDVYWYNVAYRADGEWTPLCGTGHDGVVVPALPLAGRWDYRQGAPGGGAYVADEQSFTFACRGYVLAKCVEMGYAPWREVWLTQSAPHGHVTRQSLLPWHLACGRLLRADFCGDGTSFTHDGTLINFYDGLGIRVDGDDWPVEAEWDEHGARCLATERLPSGIELPCSADLQTSECGSTAHFGLGTMLISEHAPEP
jgi:hypothetical protein